VFMWECNFHGQLGQGNREDAPKPVLVESLIDAGILRVECGSDATIALDRMYKMLFGRNSRKILFSTLPLYFDQNLISQNPAYRVETYFYFGYS